MSQLTPISNFGFNQIQANSAYKTQVSTPTTAEITKSFGDHLNEALTKVDQLEKVSHQKNDLFLAGQIDSSEVMIAANEALLSLQLTSEVRNKMIEAYQEIMRIQV